MGKTHFSGPVIVTGQAPDLEASAPQVYKVVFAALATPQRVANFPLGAAIIQITALQANGTTVVSTFNLGTTSGGVQLGAAVAGGALTAVLRRIAEGATLYAECVSGTPLPITLYIHCVV